MDRRMDGHRTDQRPTDKQSLWQNRSLQLKKIKKIEKKKGVKVWKAIEKKRGGVHEADAVCIFSIHESEIVSTPERGIRALFIWWDTFFLMLYSRAIFPLLLSEEGTGTGRGWGVPGHGMEKITLLNVLKSCFGGWYLSRAEAERCARRTCPLLGLSFGDDMRKRHKRKT